MPVLTGAGDAGNVAVRVAISYIFLCVLCESFAISAVKLLIAKPAKEP